MYFMNKKLAIIMSGGGLRASYNVGVILALAKEYNVTEPSILICGSGSAGTGSYYLAKQYDSIYNIWTNLVSSKKFVNLKRFWKLIDIDYLIDEVFKKQDPLNDKLVCSSKTKYLIPALNEKTGDLKYFDNSDRMDIFECMRATKAMPIAFKLCPNIKIDGSYYCDSPISSNAEFHIKKAVELGAKKILIINNNFNKNHSIINFILFRWFSFQGIKKNYLKNFQELKDYQLPTNVEIFTILPEKELKIKTLNNDKILLKNTIDQGYDETTNNERLRIFLRN